MKPVIQEESLLRFQAVRPPDVMRQGGGFLRGISRLIVAIEPLAPEEMASMIGCGEFHGGTFRQNRTTCDCAFAQDLPREKDQPWPGTVAAGRVGYDKLSRSVRGNHCFLKRWKGNGDDFGGEAGNVPRRTRQRSRP